MAEPKASYWADEYVEKQTTLTQAIDRIKNGQRVFIGSYCGEPQYLVQGLAEASKRFSDLEIIRLMSQETTSLSAIANRTKDQSLYIRSIYLGSAKSDELAGNRRFYMPVNVAEVPGLFKSRRIPLEAALIQVTPPDDFGWLSLGVSVDVTLAAARSADLVIAQVNDRMPRVYGQSFIHVNNVDLIVAHDEDLLAIEPFRESEAATLIGRHIAGLIEDGSTIQLGLDAASQATTRALHDKNDLGVHSYFLTDNIMHLYATGVVNNRKKGYNDGKLVAGCAIGSSSLYEFLDKNPGIDFYPFDVVADIDVIARHNKMVSINVARTVDLAGQISCDAVASTLYAGVSGIPNFVRGANRSKNGKSIIMLHSVSDDGEKSRIVGLLHNTIVTVPREDVQYVVTEYGAVNLWGKSMQERALALISIAHPDFRDDLLREAQEMGMVGAERSLGDSERGIYPVKLEETVDRAGEKITLRPAKPTDARPLQDHYYNLEKQDVISRFFHEKKRFARHDVESLSQTDYIRNMAILAVVGEVGFEKIIGVGEYYLQPAQNMAEVAFSVSRDYQEKGIGRLLIRKLAEAAQENGIAGLFAVTSSSNKRMIRLFKSLPYKVKSTLEEDVVLSCRFDDPAD